MVHYTMEYYAPERKVLLPFETVWMELENTLSETSQLVKEIVYDLSYKKNLTNKIN